MLPLLKKAFKVNVACTDGMLMSPLTFPEVSGGFFFFFCCALRVWRENKDVIMLRCPLISSYSSQNGSSSRWDARARGQVLSRHQKRSCSGLTRLHPRLQGGRLAHLHQAGANRLQRPGQSRDFKPHCSEFVSFFGFLHN